jgi:hypothetical protein
MRKGYRRALTVFALFVDLFDLTTVHFAKPLGSASQHRSKPPFYGGQET